MCILCAFLFFLLFCACFICDLCINYLCQPVCFLRLIHDQGKFFFCVCVIYWATQFKPLWELPPRILNKPHTTPRHLLSNTLHLLSLRCSLSAPLTLVQSLFLCGVEMTLLILYSLSFGKLRTLSLFPPLQTQKNLFLKDYVI